MMRIEDYRRPGSAEEAQRILSGNPGALAMGGGAFLKLGSRHAGIVVDLQDAGMRYIRRNGGRIEIGAMTTYRDLETDARLLEAFDGLIPATVRNIVGVQLRSLITVGGTVAGRYGFSELLTSLLLLDCRVATFGEEPVPLPVYLARKPAKAELVVSIDLAPEPLQTRVTAIRNTGGSLPSICVAVARDGDGWRIAAGSRPGLARRADLDAACSDEDLERIARQFEFRDDAHAAGSWRHKAFVALTRRMIGELEGRNA